MDFKTFEEKALYEMEQLENKNAELTEKIDDQQVTIKEYKERDGLFKEFLYLLNIRHRNCITGDDPMIDVETIYPHDKEVYARAEEILSRLGIVLRTE